MRLEMMAPMTTLKETWRRVSIPPSLTILGAGVLVGGEVDERTGDLHDEHDDADHATC